MYTVLTGILLFTGSCSEYFNLTPPDGLVLDEYWKTKEDVEATLMGAYQQFAKMDENLFLYGEIRADLIIQDNNTPADQRNIISGNIFATNSLCYWGDFYKIINHCNNVVKYAPEVLKIDKTFTEFKMEAFMSEAIFLRSLAYFYLVRIFKDVPYVLEPSDNDNVNFFPPKTSGKEILSNIKSDLKEVRLKIPTTYNTIEEIKGRATQAAVDALLADICLWNFEYDECLTYANNVLNTNSYFLQPSSKWFELFFPGNSLEGIFELQFDSQNGQSNSLYQNTYVLNYYEASTYAMDILFPLLSQEIIRGRGSISSESKGYKIWKYCGGAPDQNTVRPGSISGSCNFIIYRYADILLIKAESLSQLGRYDEALTLINEIRRRALMEEVNSQNTPESFEDLILIERAKEFAFEGKRWFDLLRMGRRNNFARKKKLIEIIVQNVPSTQKLVIASKLTDPDGWYLPVSSSELESNPNLVQNPFYAN
ncbi:MAG TPA: RagB/SusD family nutrient uptake outer membrane protein [Bacteroidales bacterium]|nr:RagB/SusD family nutrient uptake outer membrane protein [Bacteroidales bacterium]